MEATSPRAKRFLRITLKTMKFVLGFLLVLLTAIAIVVALIWYKPDLVLTDRRVNKLARLVLVLPEGIQYPVHLRLGLPKGKTRQLQLGFAPGCYRLQPSLHPDFRFCIERGELDVTFSLKKSTYVQLRSLDILDFAFTQIVMGPSPDTSNTEEEPETRIGPPTWMQYVSDRFNWGRILIDVRDFRALDEKSKETMKLKALLASEVGVQPTPTSKSASFIDSPLLDFSVNFENPDFIVSSKGKIRHEKDVIQASSASADFRSKPARAGGEAPMRIQASLEADYDLLNSEIRARLEAMWRNPTPEIAYVRARDVTFRMSEKSMETQASLAVRPQGKTPVGTPPVLELRAGIQTEAQKSGAVAPVDISVDIDSYAFAGMTANSDLRVRMRSYPSRTEFELRQGELRIEIPQFAETVRILERTAWAIPAPFAVLRGPVLFRTLPFQSEGNRVDIPFRLTSNLRSPDQAIITETNATLSLSAKTLAPAKATIRTELKSVRLRLPDYDPLAPVPALARDSRIIRKGDVATKAKPSPSPSASKEAQKKEDSFPIEFSLSAPRGAIVLLNRFFEPHLSAHADLRMNLDGDSGTPQGEVTLTSPFDVEYLNRKVKVETMRMGMAPHLSFHSLITMERSGYLIKATISQEFGQTRIDLGSEPPLSNDEIVSLLLYGMPRNSISSEQTRSVGSAQSAIESNALGIFSFWAFASTPIESVLYDPATQTYSAVVRLPGGVVASIGSNWENDRQVSLSKSIGRNWAVSTELVRDAEGIDRGGTLLRWRKSY
jgi:hypothetical protein